MIYFVLVSYILCAVILLFVFLFLISRLSLPTSKNDPPLISSRASTLPIICRKFTDINEKSVVCELGSGDARVLGTLWYQNKDAVFWGVEKKKAPYLFSSFYWRVLRRRKKMYFTNEDIFRADLSATTHIYAYLFTSSLDALLPKLHRELKPGTLFISLDFAFHEKTPEKIISLEGENKAKWHLGGKQLFVYRF